MARALINIASWEERFIETAKRQIMAGAVDTVVTFASERFFDATAENRAALLGAASAAGVEIVESSFDFDDPVATYRGIKSAISLAANGGATDFKFDISTARRDILWTTLSAMRQTSSGISVVYCSAANYAGWQTEEEGDPRLVLNRSGILYPDLPTFVVLMCGLEVARAEKLKYRFEPRGGLILRDTDVASFGELRQFSTVSSATFKEFDFDNKDVSDANVERLQALLPSSEEYNLVCGSFGPKIGAVLLDRLVERRPEIALAYVPARRYNFEHCRGVGTTVEVKLR